MSAVQAQMPNSLICIFFTSVLKYSIPKPFLKYLGYFLFTKNELVFDVHFIPFIRQVIYCIKLLCKSQSSQS